MSNSDYRFEIAISFAGDNKRDSVRKVAGLLQEKVGKGKVFFDEWFESELAGADAQLVLQNYYGKRTRLVVACVCQRYNEKPWTQDEWRAILAFERDLRDAGTDNVKRMRFLPLKFGDGEVDGLFSTAMVPDVRDRTPEEIAELILQRLDHAKQEGATLVTSSPNALAGSSDDRTAAGPVRGITSKKPPPSLDQPQGQAPCLAGGERHLCSTMSAVNDAPFQRVLVNCGRLEAVGGKCAHATDNADSDVPPVCSSVLESLVSVRIPEKYDSDLSFVREARRLDMIAVTFRGFVPLISALRAAILQGNAVVRVLLLDPRSEELIARARLPFEVARELPEASIKAIKVLQELALDMRRKSMPEENLQCSFYRRTPHYGCILSDIRIRYSPYLSTTRPCEGLTFDVSPGTPLGQLLQTDFDNLWNYDKQTELCNLRNLELEELQKQVKQFWRQHKERVDHT